MEKMQVYKKKKYKRKSSGSDLFFCKLSKKQKEEFSKQQQKQLSMVEVEIHEKLEEIKQEELEEAKRKETLALEEAGQQVGKQKSKKKKIINLIFFLINIAVVVAIFIVQLSGEQVTPIKDLFSLGVIKFGYIFLIIFLFILVMGSDTLRSYILIYKSTKKKRPFLSYKMVAIGRYYDSVTPMSTGGQPFQVFYLSNRGVETSSSISVPMARYVISQISWIILSLICVFLSAKYLGQSNVISVASYVGFALNFLTLAVTLTLSMSKKLAQTIIAKTLRLLEKMKIVKNYEKQYEKVMKVVSGYQTTMMQYAKSFGSFLMLIFISLLQNFIIFCIPCVIYLFFGGTDPSQFLTIFVYTVLIELAASFIPLPGGTGVNELSFTAIFASIFTPGTVFWGLLLWRFMNYYIYLLQGLLLICYDYFVGNKKYQWLKKKWELESESVKFKEEQIKRYQKQRKKYNIKS